MKRDYEKIEKSIAAMRILDDLIRCSEDPSFTLELDRSEFKPHIEFAIDCVIEALCDALEDEEA